MGARHRSLRQIQPAQDWRGEKKKKTEAVRERQSERGEEEEEEERRTGQGGGGEEERGGGSWASKARTNRSPNKEIKGFLEQCACVWAAILCLCVLWWKGAGKLVVFGKYKNTHTRSHAGLHLAAQSHLTGLICGPPTSLSLPHSSTVLCSLSLSLTNTKSHSLARSLCCSHWCQRFGRYRGAIALITVCCWKREGTVGSPARPRHPARPLLPSISSSISTSNVQRKRMLQLNESNPSGIEAIIEAAGTVFCFFRPPLLFLVPFILSRAGGESVFSPF